MSRQQVLSDGLAALDLELPRAAVRQLLDFLALIAKWNRVYNLTAISDPDAMVARHLLDSLAVLPHVDGPRVIDVGTGAGLPGIPLAIARPDWRFVLLDANAKKTRFVHQAVAELGLDNVEVVQSRAEACRPEVLFDTVITRAYAALADMLAQTRHLCHNSGRFVAMKGDYPVREIEALPAGFAVRSSHALDVPGLQARRHVIIMEKATDD